MDLLFNHQTQNYMSTLRTIGAIIAGYLAYGTASMFLVGVVTNSSGAIHYTIGFLGLSLTAVLSASIMTLILNRDQELSFFIVSGLIFLVNTANLVFQLGAEPVWYKMSTLLLVAPLLSLVGFIRRKKKMQNSQLSKDIELA